MSGLEHEAREPGAPDPEVRDNRGIVREGDFEAKAGAIGRDRTAVGRRGVPRWRQIEILRERQQLRRMLDDFGDDDVDFDDEVFGVGQDSGNYYDSGAEPEDEVDDIAVELGEEVFFED